MATPTSDALRVQPELDALVQKLQNIDRNVSTERQQMLEYRAQFEESQKVRKDEFEVMKREELRKLQEQKELFQLFQEQQKHLILWEKEALSKEKESFEQCQQRAAEVSGSQEPITLEVGNDKFRTQISTLAKCKGSIFPRLVENLQGRHNEHRIFIDRDGKHFRFILNFMRQGERVMRGPISKNIDKYVLEEIIAEVEYYKLHELERLLRRKLVSIEKPKIDFNFMASAKYFIKCTPPTPHIFVTSNEIVLKNSNLDNITFDRVDFRHPVTVDTCTMIKARFTNCTISGPIRFKNVDMEGVRFENCVPVDVAKYLHFIETDPTAITFSPPV